MGTLNPTHSLTHSLCATLSRCTWQTLQIITALTGDGWVFKLVPSSLCLCSIVTHNRTRGCRRQLAAAGDSCWAPRRISSSSSVQTAQHPLSSSVLNATYWAPLPTRCARARWRNESVVYPSTSEMLKGPPRGRGRRWGALANTPVTVINIPKQLKCKAYKQAFVLFLDGWRYADCVHLYSIFSSVNGKCRAEKWRIN